MRNLSITLLFALLIGSITACKPKRGLPHEHKNPLELLIGTWYLNRYELYHRIYFQDSIHVGFDTHIDTILFYEYSLRGDTMELYDKYGELVNHNIILKLDRDSLVFGNLLDKEGIQRYSRFPAEVEKKEE